MNAPWRDLFADANHCPDVLVEPNRDLQRRLYIGVWATALLVLFADLWQDATRQRASFDKAGLSIIVPLTRRYRGSAASFTNDSALVPLSLSADPTIKDLKNIGNTQYSVTVGIGTPPQSEELLVDTGSSDLWVARGKFNPTASSTAQVSELQVSIEYGQGGVTGQRLSDDMSMGDLGDLHIRDQQFVTLTSQDNSLNSIQADGILGLGPPGLSHTGATVLQQLLLQFGIATFCLALTPYVTGSQLALGEPPSSWYQPETLVYAPVVSPSWWSIEAELWVDNEPIQKGIFILDSGTSFLTASASHYTEFVTSILPPGSISKCRADPRTKIYSCPCSLSSSMRPVNLRVGGKLFPIATQDLFVPLADKDDECVLEVQSVADSSPQILGDTFLREVVAIFDNSQPQGPRIGIAQRSSSSPGTSEQRWEFWRLLLRRIAFICLPISGFLLLNEMRIWVTECRRAYQVAPDGINTRVTAYVHSPVPGQDAHAVLHTEYRPL